MRTRLRAAFGIAATLGLLCGLAASLAPPAEASRNSSGTYSLPSGNPVVSGTAISSTWANSTLSDLGAELTNSLDRQGRGAMLAPLKLSSGTAAAPGLAFSAEAGSGLYRAGAGDVRMSLGGTAVQSWTGSGTSVTGTLSATGAATLSSTLGVTGAATVSGGATVTTSATNGSGVTATGNGTGAGVTATGGSSSGAGGSFAGGGTGAGGRFTAGTAATATTARDAVVLTNGYMDLSGAVDPNSNVGFSDRLTPKNIVKAWGRLSTNGSGGVTITDAFNISGCSIPSIYVVQCTFAAEMGNTNYATIISPGNTGTVTIPAPGASVTTSFSASFYSITTGSLVDVTAVATSASFLVLGVQ